jgi:hypothetical protein
MAYNIDAYSQPDYDDWGWDDYWDINDWRRWYDALEQQFGASEAGKKWLEAWHRQSLNASPINNESQIITWAIGKGLAYAERGWFQSQIKKPGDFIPPSTSNEGQVIIDPTTGQPRTVGNQQDEAVIVKEEKKEKSKNTIWLVIGSLVVLMGVTFIVLKVKQNKAQ